MNTPGSGIAPAAAATILDRILDLEAAMFVSVKSDVPAPCQNDLQSFCIMRRAQFSVWPPDALESYCQDLARATEQGINLMTLKYARMDDLIRELNTSPLIGEIVSAFVAWQKDMQARYPRLMARGRPLSQSGAVMPFDRYFRCELETYSDRTLSMLARAVRQWRDREENMAEKIYQGMVRELGYNSLADAEAAAGGLSAADIT